MLVGTETQQGNSLETLKSINQLQCIIKHIRYTTNLTLGIMIKFILNYILTLEATGWREPEAYPQFPASKEWKTQGEISDCLYACNPHRHDIQAQITDLEFSCIPGILNSVFRSTHKSYVTAHLKCFFFFFSPLFIWHHK